MEMEEAMGAKMDGDHGPMQEEMHGEDGHSNAMNVQRSLDAEQAMEAETEQEDGHSPAMNVQRGGEMDSQKGGGIGGEMYSQQGGESLASGGGVDVERKHPPVKEYVRREVAGASSLDFGNVGAEVGGDDEVVPDSDEGEGDVVPDSEEEKAEMVPDSGVVPDSEEDFAEDDVGSLPNFSQIAQMDGADVEREEEEGVGERRADTREAGAQEFYHQHHHHQALDQMDGGDSGGSARDQGRAGVEGSSSRETERGGSLHNLSQIAQMAVEEEAGGVEGKGVEGSVDSAMAMTRPHERLTDSRGAGAHHHHHALDQMDGGDSGGSAHHSRDQGAEGSREREGGGDRGDRENGRGDRGDDRGDRGDKRARSSDGSRGDGQRGGEMRAPDRSRRLMAKGLALQQGAGASFNGGGSGGGGDAFLRTSASGGSSGGGGGDGGGGGSGSILRRRSGDGGKRRKRGALQLSPSDLQVVEVGGDEVNSLLEESAQSESHGGVSYTEGASLGPDGSRRASHQESGRAEGVGEVGGGRAQDEGGGCGEEESTVGESGAGHEREEDENEEVMANKGGAEDRSVDFVFQDRQNPGEAGADDMLQGQSGGCVEEELNVGTQQMEVKEGQEGGADGYRVTSPAPFRENGAGEVGDDAMFIVPDTPSQGSRGGGGSQRAGGGSQGQGAVLPETPDVAAGKAVGGDDEKADQRARGKDAEDLSETGARSSRVSFQSFALSPPL